MSANLYELNWEWILLADCSYTVGQKNVTSLFSPYHC